MNNTPTNSESLHLPFCSRLVLQRRYRPSYGIPKPWTEWHDHPEPHQIAWGPGQYATLEENMKAACEGYYALGQGCEFRMVRRTDETLWEYSANPKDQERTASPASDCSKNQPTTNTIMNNTPTPRTDERKASNGQWSYVLKLCAEELERELTAAREEMPVGYIPNHTIETLPTMIQEQSQMLAEETTCSEKLQEQRDKYRDIASELIAMIRINVMRDTFKIATIEQVGEHLKQWIARIAAVKGGANE